MYRQDKATTERHARILRELVKRPDNKMCADCKRQDARWASWNIGVFVCIRCSGIHRSMGTHISKVKSVDLDTWTVEQMESVQRWGNHRANLYWEAHLRPGHVPPESKMDSFIRSKYESRRWAREGPPPSDPSVLENEAGVSSEHSASDAPTPTPAVSSPPLSSPSVTSRQPQPHRLLSTATSGRASPAQPVQVAAAQQAKAPEAPKPAPQPQNDLFSLDFHAPSPSAAQQQQQQAPKKDVKNDILSLFSAPPAAAAAPTAGAAFGQFGAPQQDSFGQWGQPQAQPQPQAQSISMMGTSGTGMWGVNSGWAPAPPPAQPDVWGGFQNVPAAVPAAPLQQSSQNLFETQNVWGSGSGAGAQPAGGANDLFGSSFGGSTAPASTQKKDDAFGDLWGDFK